MLLPRIRRAPTRVECGLAIVDLSDDSSLSAIILDRAAQALRLIDDADHRRMKRMANDVQFVIVPPVLFGLAAHSARLRAIFVRDDILRAHPIETTASLLVHEGTHARIASAGITMKHKFSRIEELCYREQLLFTRRLSGAQYLIPWLEGIVEAQAWGRDERSGLQSVRELKVEYIKNLVRTPVARLFRRANRDSECHE